jgi:RND family efflux transporter MFP subunit
MPGQAQSRPLRGITEPYKESTIGATVPGKIAAIKYHEGDVVQKGNTIIVLENTVENLETERRKLIAESKVELTAAQHQVKTLKQDYEATKDLYETAKSVSEEELWKKELEYNRSIAELDRIKLMEEKEEIEYKIARAELWKRSISAPFTGTIVKIFYKEGESCKPYEPLVKIVYVDKCRFITSVDESASTAYKKGMTVYLNIKGGSSPITGTVDFVSPVVDPSSGLREIKVVFDNTVGAIHPGVSGTMASAGQ